MSPGLAQFNEAFPWYFPIAATLFGACIGSFLNVVIYRMPKGESVVTPGSHCGCGKPIAWRDNIPVLSWLLLRGRARCCGRKFSFRYPAVELLTAALFLACALLFPPAKAVSGMILLSCLVAATFIDLDHFIIPDVFTIGLAVVGVVLSLLVPSLHGQTSGLFIIDSLRSGANAVEGMFIGSGLVLWIAFLAEAILKKEAMGFGDVKFVGAIGAFTGWEGAVATMALGSFVGLAWTGLAMLIKKAGGNADAIAPRAETEDGKPAEVGLGVHIPFGPMLAIGAAIYFLGFDRIVLAYLAQTKELF